MKNKLLSIILLLVFCTQAFAISTASAAQDTAEAEYDKVLFNDALGLNRVIYPQYPCEKSPEAPVTRGEFSMMITGIMGATSLSDVYTCFTDVPYDNPAAASVAFLTDIGVISEGQLFYPDSPILYPQALKMAVALAGYTVKAEATGGYPSGYMVVANSMDLTQGLTLTNDTMSFADVTILLYNLLESDIFRQVVFGDKIEYAEGDGHTFLSYYHKINITTGRVNVGAYSGLTDMGAALGDNNIQIENSFYKIDDDSYNDYLGHNVKAYYRKNGNKNIIVYMTSYNENTVTLIGRDVSAFEDFKLEVYTDGKEEIYNIAKSYIYLKNSKHLSITDNDQTPYFRMDSAILTLIDNDMDKVYDVVSVKSYNYSLISSVDTVRETISDQNSNANFLNLGDTDCVYKIYDTGNEGYEEIELSDLSRDTLIAYTISDDKKVCNIYVVNNTVDAVLTATENGSNDIYLDDVCYRTSQYYNTYCTSVTLGTKARFYIGIDGTIVYAMDLGSSKYSYGWIVGISDTIGLEKDLKIKIFSQNGEMITPYLPDKVSLDGTSTPAGTLKSNIENWDDDKRFVKYALNSEGKLSGLITYTDAASDVLPGSANSSERDLVRYYSRTNNFEYWTSPSLFVHESLATTNMLDKDPITEKSSFRISSSTYCFIIPEASKRSDDENFKVTKSSFSNASSYAISAYDIDETSHAAATLCIGIIQPSSTSRANMIIEKISTALNNKGETSIAVSGYSFENSRYITCYADLSMKSETDKLNPGDLVRLAYDENNEIAGTMYKDFDLESYEFRISNPPTASDYISGLIYSYNGGYMNLITNCETNSGRPVFPQTADRSKIGTLLINEASLMFVDVKRTADGSGVESVVVRPSNATEIKTYIEAGNNAHYCAARRYQYGRASTIVIYNILN